MSDIKEVIRDFVNFDIENDYYKDDDKKNLVNMFEKILFEDETTVRQFLKTIFESFKNSASQFGLVAPEGEVVEIGSGEEPEDAGEEPEDAGEELEDAGEEPEDAGEENEDKKIYRNIAANILYD